MASTMVLFMFVMVLWPNLMLQADDMHDEYLQ